MYEGRYKLLPVSDNHTRDEKNSQGNCNKSSRYDISFSSFARTNTLTSVVNLIYLSFTNSKVIIKVYKKTQLELGYKP